MGNLGHNNPPSTPFDECKQTVDDLYDEAKQWLDGQKVDSEAYAESIGTLLNMLRKAGKASEDARVEEKAPFLEKTREVDEKYKPLTARVKTATDACKAALAPWLKAKEDALRTEQEAARKKADEEKAKAQEAMRQSAHDDLAAREAAEAQLEAAKKLEQQANKLDKKSSNTKGAIGKAVGLTTYWETTLENPTEAARHYWATKHGKEAINEVLLKLGKSDVAAGKREIPGFTITKESRVV